MPRRSKSSNDETQPPATDFVFDLDNLTPLSQVPPEQLDAYWTQLMAIPGLDTLRAAIATEEFFPLLKLIPKAFWEKRFFVYLYRQWPKVKNAEKDKYIDKYPFAIDESSVKEEHGGGGYLAYLNLDGKEQLKQITFAIDGPPKLKPGQILTDAQGNPIPQTPTTPPPATDTDIAKVINASAEANRVASELTTTAAKAAIDIVREQAATASQPGPSPISQLGELATVIKSLMPAPATPIAPDPLQAKLMEKIIDRAFAKQNPEPEKTEDDETLFERGAAIVERVTGKPLHEVMNGKSSRNPAADPVSGWAPIVSSVTGALGQFFDKLPAMQQARNETLRLEIQLRQLELAKANGGQVPPALLAPPPAQPAQQPTRAATTPPQPAALPQPPDKNQTIALIVNRICQGFDRHRDSGSDIAASVSVEFGELIEMHGLERAMWDVEAVTPFLAEMPQLAGQLAQRSQHAHFEGFQSDYLDYMHNKWGELGEENDEAQESQPELKPVA